MILCPEAPNLLLTHIPDVSGPFISHDRKPL